MINIFRHLINKCGVMHTVNDWLSIINSYLKTKAFGQVVVWIRLLMGPGLLQENFPQVWSCIWTGCFIEPYNLNHLQYLFSGSFRPCSHPSIWCMKSHAHPPAHSIVDLWWSSNYNSVIYYLFFGKIEDTNKIDSVAM